MIMMASVQPKAIDRVRPGGRRHPGRRSATYSAADFILDQTKQQFTFALLSKMQFDLE